MARGRIEPEKLDDRTWQDLVDQAEALIPHYAPRWTDRGPSDLGVTLIELFAWLVEGMIYRLNRVPERNYVAFLNLLGITRSPATPATTRLTYTSTAVVEVPQGSQAATQQTEAREAVVFETDAALTVLPANLVALHGENLGGEDAGKLADLTTPLVGVDEPGRPRPATGARLALKAGDGQQDLDARFLLGFQGKADRRYALHVQVAEPGWSGESRVGVEYLGPGSAWKPIDPGEVEDRTAGLRRAGTISFPPPADWAESPPADPAHPPSTKPLYWLRLAFHRLAPATDPRAPDALEVQHILFNSVAATAAPTFADEEVGQGTGRPFQSFELARRPVYKDPLAADPYGHLKLRVEEPVGAVPARFEAWRRVDQIGPGEAREYRLDPVTGTIYFGGLAGTGDVAGPAPAGRDVGGKAPPAGARLVATYRHVAGGASGNLPGFAIETLRTPNDKVRVANHVRALGGTDEEGIEEAKRRAPEALRNFDRAVTLEDYEQLARRASNRVRKARCLGPRFADEAAGGGGVPWTFGGIIRREGAATVVILEDVAAGDDPKKLDRQPRPTAELIHEIRAYLNDRRPLATALTVTGPRYRAVAVTITVRLWPEAVAVAADAGGQASRDRLAAEIDARIALYLHPIRGKRGGNGWDVGESLFISGLFEFLTPTIADLGYIEELSAVGVADYKVSPADDQAGRPGFKPASGVGVLDYEILCSARAREDRWHDVRVLMVGQ